jgi:hypothetical protein
MNAGAARIILTGLAKDLDFLLCNRLASAYDAA